MGDEDQTTALREEVRHTARAMANLLRRQLRPRLIWSGVGVALAGGLLALVVLHPDYLVLLVFAHALMLPVLFGIVGVVLHADTMSKIIAQHRTRQQQLVERLRSLPREQIAATLLPLRSDAEGEVRALAKRLLRRIDLHSELTPAAAPDACGDEASPAAEVP